MNKIKIIRKDEQLTSKWSGGSTTEIYIYPEECIYANRDFTFRISTATIEIEQSDFTPLPSYNRLIMPISSSVKLEHKGKHMAELNQFEVDAFSGSWQTKSFGKCTDFNLIYSENWNGKLLACTKGEYIIEKGFNFIFSLIDELQVKIRLNNEDKLLSLNKGDIVLVKEDSGSILLESDDANNKIAVLIQTDPKNK